MPDLLPIGPEMYILDMLFRFSTIAAMLDILLVAGVLYWLMLMFKGTRAERMLWGLAVIVLVYFLSFRVELLTLHWILSNFLGSIAIFIIVVFQQDIRRALVQMGRPFSSKDMVRSIENLEEITKAVIAMSASRTGCLIVIERAVDLTEFLDTGVEIDAKASRELLLSIFNSNSPMHDGAVVIRGNRILKAGCILPLSEKELSKSMGTRHRAAVGLAEETDAIIIVASEETGDVTLVVEDELEMGVNPADLLDSLKAIFAKKGKFKKALFNWKAN